MTLSQMLQPLGRNLDAIWWYLRGQGVNLPSPDIEVPPIPLNGNDEDWGQWREENKAFISAVEAQDKEYAAWLDDTGVTMSAYLAGIHAMLIIFREAEPGGAFTLPASVHCPLEPS